MKKAILFMAILVLVAMFVLGCNRGPDYNYPTGYAASGGQPQSQGYVGGGCAVAGPEPVMPLDVSGPAAAA